MDFVELESIEGLRFPWNTWPSSPSSSSSSSSSSSTSSAAAALFTPILPLSLLHTPLFPLADLPLLPYDPLHCSSCNSTLNPYARVDYRYAIWACPFCHSSNHFPKSYSSIGENQLPAELFPTHSSVEYSLRLNKDGGVGVVFVVDLCMEEVEMAVLKREILGVVTRLEEEVSVGLITFGEGGSVWVYDLGFRECSRVVVFDGKRQISVDKISELLSNSNFTTNHPKFGLGKSSSVGRKLGFLLPISECEFNITTAIEEITCSSRSIPGHRTERATGSAIAAAVAILGVCLPAEQGARILVFTSGPATTGPGLVVQTDLGEQIRTHHDILSCKAPFYVKACEFYNNLADKLCEKSLVLDLFACSLDQVGASEMRVPVENSGGLMVLTESFESEQFKKCLRYIFRRKNGNYLDMNFNATIEVVTSRDIKINGALGPCMSLRNKNRSVSDREIGQGGTNLWKLGTITNKTCIAFFFKVGNRRNTPQSGPVFFLQFQTRYRHGDGGYRLRVTTAARRWSHSISSEVASGFDQEAAASIMARLAVSRAKEYHSRDIIRWIDKLLIRFCSTFGEYIQEDPSSFHLSSNFSLFPQFMYYLRRSQFIDVFNNTPDETAFFRLMLNREGVVGSLIMIQPTLFQYSFDGPPVPVVLDISSVSPNVILLFDSYFYVVIHYGSKIAQWRKLGYHNDPSHENFRKLLEAPELDVEMLLSDRFPTPKVIRCDQHGSQARFLLAKLNPSLTQKSLAPDGTDIILTDDVSLEFFIEHLQELAVQG